MELMPSPPRFVHWATRTLEDEGYETWAVGGAIRNTLLGLPTGDWDLATRAPPDVVRRLFPRTVPIGIEHGTVGVLTRDGTLLEVTTFRKDVETFGRKAVVEFADTLEEDLSRRDFTVNAVAWHALTGRFQDPFFGREDLEKKVLRSVGSPEDRFGEDYLRVLRGLRFSGRFGLSIEKTTWTALRASSEHLGILSPERVREELLKVLGKDDKPSGALSLYLQAGVLTALYPELWAIQGKPRTPWAKGIGPEDLWTHSLLLTDALPAEKPLLRLVALFQGVGAPGPESGRGDLSEKPASATQGDLLARDRAAALLMRLRFSNAEIREVTELIQIGAEPPVVLATRSELRKWLHLATPDRLPQLARIWIAKTRLDRRRWGTSGAPVVDLLKRLRAESRSGAPLRSEDLAIDGRDLIAMGLRPGPRFKAILVLLMDRVLEDPGLNNPETLRAMVLEMEEPSEGGAG